MQYFRLIGLLLSTVHTLRTCALHFAHYEFRIPVSRFPDSRIPGFPDSRIPGFPDSRIPGFPDSRIPGFPDSRIPRFPDSRIPGIPDPGIRIPGFPDSRISASGFPDSRIPGSQTTDPRSGKRLQKAESLSYQMSAFAHLTSPKSVFFGFCVTASQLRILGGSSGGARESSC